MSESHEITAGTPVGLRMAGDGGPSGLLRSLRDHVSSRAVDVAIGSAAVLVLLFAWALLAHYRVVKPLFLPSPAAVLRAFAEAGGSGYNGLSLSQHLAASAARVLTAFALAGLTGIPLGLAMGQSRYVRAVFDPLIEFTRPVPPLALQPLLIIWVGIGDLGKVALLFTAIFGIFVVAAAAGVRSVAVDRIRAARSLGAAPWQVFVHVMLPSALPEIFTGARVAMGTAWTTIVAAEMVASVSGIGWLVLNASRYLRSDVIVVGIIVMAATGFTLDHAIRALEHRLVPWRGLA